MRFPAIATIFLSTMILAGYAQLSEAAVISRLPPPNILFVIMDDVGIDQMTSFGYGGKTAAAMPMVNQLAKSGIRFRNNWSMPACSPSRAVFFEGRFPMRSNVLGALGPSDLANSMVSPFDITAPKLLKQKNYQSGLFGKFHLGLQGNNPYGYSMVKSLGWDYFYGWLDQTGDPSSIDTTAGGVGAVGAYSCGYVPGSNHGGADSGACYTPGNLCKNLSTTTQINPAGRICRDSGGVFEPNGKCPSPGSSPPANINFALLNSHFVSPLVINGQQIPLTDLRARAYRGVAPVTAAIDWIKTRPKGKPWMASVSFATDHTPLIQPPYSLLSSGSIDTNGLDCSNSNSWPVLSNQMIEAMDTEIGRLLVDTGLATRNSDSSLNYDPKKTDTMIILVGDNGTLGGVVKLPFDPTRAKGSSYQTGVWVPLVVTGPLVVKPDRNVEHMTNIADIYQLFGEIAGIDVHKTVPWIIDSKAMMPYVKNPKQPSIRSWNFNQIDLNLQANGAINGPCVMGGGSSCSHIPVTKSVCEDNNGVWWGEGASGSIATGGPVPLTHCCEVNIWLHDNAPSTALPNVISQASLAIRNVDYKNVRTYTKNYDATRNACVDTQTDELYKINQAVPIPKIDKDGDNLLVNGFSTLTATEKRNYLALNKKLKELQNSNVVCDGDGNLDGVVNQKDLTEWAKFSKTKGGPSSWYDFNLDGLTNEADKQIIVYNLGNKCK
jgi:hypothetical protein